MPNVKRLQKLPGSKTVSKKPTQSELSILVKELQAITMAQQESQADIAASIKQLSHVVLSAAKDGFDVSKIVDAIAGLKDKITEKGAMGTAFDYEINFERDKFHLIKTGIKLSAVSRRLN